MCLVVPYVDGMLVAETQRWGEEHGAEFVRLEGDDGYYKALCRWWEEPGDLVIVEQDMLPTTGVVEEMLACEFEWCSSPFLVHANSRLDGWGLGCTKFSEEMRRRIPSAAQLAGQPGEHDPEPGRVWWMLDVRLGCVLARHYVLPHGHAESIHLHGRNRHVHEQHAYVKELA